jgi:hypothetical protein
MRALLLALSILAISLPAYAQSGLRLGKASYGGTGCPAGTAAVALSADRQSLSLRFDRYQVAAGAGRSFDRKSCNLAVPLSVPAGISVAVVAVDYRGVNRLPAGAIAQFRAEYFFAGGRGPVLARAFDGPLQGRFALSDTIAARLWSACGADVTLRANTSLRVSTSAGRPASSSVRAQDIKTAIIYRLQWRNC